MPGAGPVEKLHILRNFIVLAVLASVAVVLGGLWSLTQPLAPEESDAHAALRDSPDNAYLILLEALKLFPPEVPPPTTVASPDGKQVEFKPARDSIARRLAIRRPDDDPEVLAYLARCAPVVEKTREAFSKPYCMLPGDLAAQEMAGTIDEPASFKLAQIGGLLGACAIDAFSRKDFPQASQAIFDLLRLCLMLRDDDLWMAGGMMMDVTVNYVARVIQELPPDVLQAAIGNMRALRTAERPPVDAVRFTLRSLHGMINSSAVGAEDLPGSSLISHGIRIYWNWPLKKKFPTYRSIEKAAAMPYAKFKRLLPADAATSKGGLGDLPLRALSFLDATLAAPLQMDAMLAGLEVRATLEIYRQTHGAYPDKLDDLKEAAADLPNDPFSGKPFVYRKTSDTECSLYSIGQNLRDDHGHGDDYMLGTDAPGKPENLG